MMSSKQDAGMAEASPSQSDGQPEPVYKTTIKPFDALDWKLYQFMRDNEEELADHYMGGLLGSAPEDDPLNSEVQSARERFQCTPSCEIHSHGINRSSSFRRAVTGPTAAGPTSHREIGESRSRFWRALSVRSSQAGGRLDLKPSERGRTFRLVSSNDVISNASRPSGYAVPRIWL